jgi:hypothetical protein
MPRVHSAHWRELVGEEEAGGEETGDEDGEVFGWGTRLSYKNAHRQQRVSIAHIMRLSFISPLTMALPTR